MVSMMVLWKWCFNDFNDLGRNWAVDEPWAMGAPDCCSLGKRWTGATSVLIHRKYLQTTWICGSHLQPWMQTTYETWWAFMIGSSSLSSGVKHIWWAFHHKKSRMFSKYVCASLGILTFHMTYDIDTVCARDLSQYRVDIDVMYLFIIWYLYIYIFQLFMHINALTFQYI